MCVNNISRVIFVNRFYRPDLSATAQILTDLAELLASESFEVLVVASASLYQDSSVRLPSSETVGGVQVSRIKTTRFGRANLWYRAIDYASFYVGMLWWLVRNISRGDHVMLMTDPPLMSLVATRVIHIKGGKVINWLQDIYPEIAMRLGAFPGPAWLSHIVERWRNRSLRKAVINVALGPSMKRFLAGQQVENVQIIPNWSDDEAVIPLQHADNPLRVDWQLEDRFCVVYSGNFGRVHRFESLVDAADLLRHEEHIRFVLIGEGAALDDIYGDVELRGLKNVRFEPYQARDQLRYSLGAADVHLVSLHHLMEGLVFPSKLYGVLAAGRPLIFLGSEDGDIAELVKKKEIGMVVPPDDGARLADAICKLAGDPEWNAAMGVRARELCDARFSRAHSLLVWKKMLLDIFKKN